jgi:replication factor C subunit 3/5
MLWADAYSPTTLSDLYLHPRLAQLLGSMAKNRDVPNLLLYGPVGSGKRTAVRAMIHDLYGAEHHTTTKRKKVKVTYDRGKKATTENSDVDLLSSDAHIELNCNDIPQSDARHVVFALIKQMAEIANPLSSSLGVGFKIIVLHDADVMPTIAQFSLRRTMEQYQQNCRLILICKHLNKIAGPIRSRCFCLRVPAPNEMQIQKVLQDINKDQYADASPNMIENISHECDRNLRRAIVMLEAVVVDKVSTMFPPTPEWITLIEEIVNAICGHPTVSQVAECRETIDYLITHCIPTSVIFRYLLKALARQQKDIFKIAMLAADYEHRAALGSTPMIHLESFLIESLAHLTSRK